MSAATPKKKRTVAGTPPTKKSSKVAVDVKNRSSTKDRMPKSPIASKVQKQSRPNQNMPACGRQLSNEDVFSPARWRRTDDTIMNTKPATDRNALPAGDPLGVLYYLLDEDPHVFEFMSICPRTVPKHFQDRPPVLPAKTKNVKNTLVLDLDETLVHCTTEAAKVYSPPDATFTVSFNGQDYTVYMRKRPYLLYFLKQVAKWFEVVIFTASQQCYADKLLDVIDPDRTLISYRVFRESCVQYHENFLKPLGILNRDPKNVFIVDNSPQCFSFELDNGIPITSWFEDKRDNEFLHLLPYFRDMKDLDDVRPFIAKQFGTRAFLDRLKACDF